jgi:methionyl-tRNA formyltransferase
MPIRIVFMGSPEFALPTLRALHAQYLVVGVVTQPDKPAGRGQTLTPPPVKALAQELGIPLIQPRRLREPEAMAQLREWNPHLVVVAAFGQILKPEALNLPPQGCVNVHASLLPRWRGAAPIQAAILAGDGMTGITIMKMDPGLDTGPVFTQRALEIHITETAGALSDRLAALGAELLIESLPAILEGRIAPRAQDTFEATPTYAPMLKKEDGLLDFTKPAAALARQVRAMTPWPGAYTLWAGQILKVQQAHAAEGPSPGTGIPVVWQGSPGFGASEGILILDQLQPAGKKSMPGKTFLQGARQWQKY